MLSPVKNVNLFSIVDFGFLSIGLVVSQPALCGLEVRLHIENWQLRKCSETFYRFSIEILPLRNTILLRTIITSLFGKLLCVSTIHSNFITLARNIKSLKNVKFWKCFLLNLIFHSFGFWKIEFEKFILFYFFHSSQFALSTTSIIIRKLMLITRSLSKIPRVQKLNLKFRKKDFMNLWSLMVPCFRNLKDPARHPEDKQLTGQLRNIDRNLVMKTPKGILGNIGNGCKNVKGLV